jgi:hypothetical protein
MAKITAKNFPGTYTSVTDISFRTPSTSRFSAGIVGVASKGPFDVATRVRSPREFRSLFGNRVTSSNSFMMDAVDMVGTLSDDMVVVRVGNRYAPIVPLCRGTAAAFTIEFASTDDAKMVDPTLYSPLPGSSTAEVYLTISQPGKKSTVNAKVISVTGDTATLDTALADTYGDPTVTEDNVATTGVNELTASFAGEIGLSRTADAAFSAESTLYAYTWSQVDLGTVSAAAKNGFSLKVTANGTVGSPIITRGTLLKIAQANKVSTFEVMVKEVLPDNTVLLETYNNSETGYQALPLQDTYSGTSTGGAGATVKVYKATGAEAFLYLTAASAGEWANTTTTSGLAVTAHPGSKAGTKKLQVFENGSLVETIDNLVNDPSSSDYYTARLENSAYIRVAHDKLGSGDVPHVANTANGWNVNPATPLPSGFTGGKMNTSAATGGWFANGANGSNPVDADWVGTLNADDDTYTGIKTFLDTDNIDVDVILAPQDNISPAVASELVQVAKRTNSFAFYDVWSGIPLRKAIDWHNGVGEYSGSMVKIDSSYGAVFWNWLRYVDSDGVQKLIPPSIGALRCMAYTFNKEKPWRAIAGDTRGLVPECYGVEYEKVAAETKEASYGEGNSINSFLLMQGTVELFGQRTLQRRESKLTAINNMILVNEVVKRLARVGRRFVFEPNDAELVTLVDLEFSAEMDKIKNDRGVERYDLEIDGSAERRNNREMLVEVEITPTDALEKLYINATVNSSGAELNSTN